MTDATATLARSITWASSKQSYYTARLMVDHDLVDDCYRAYAYLRWADDIIDVSAESSAERISFIERQIDLVDRLYRGERPDSLTPEEEMLTELISHDRGENSGLQSFIRNFVAILEFDARRKGKLITQQELKWYASCLGKAVTDGIQYLVGNDHDYPTSENQYLAATAAHITHMLRDMIVDTVEGFTNIPREYLEANNISPQDVDSPPFQAWVRSRVEQAREYFRAGKRYLDRLEVLRCKIVGYWYCHRFEVVLDAIERDDYALRAEYEEPRRFVNWLRIGWLAIRICLRHITRPKRQVQDP
jgi:phytoene/squalene synthetase